MTNGKFCPEHGNTLTGTDPRDYWFMCDTCARSGCKPCSCGGHVRSFGEALMQMAWCEDCDERVSYVGYHRDVRQMWNEGLRGKQDDILPQS